MGGRGREQSKQIETRIVTISNSTVFEGFELLALIAFVNELLEKSLVRIFAQKSSAWYTLPPD